MIPILRHEPGSVTPASGMYALVDHYGEATSYSVRRNKGERLPMVSAISNAGPFWFVLMDETHQPARAA